MLKIEFFFKCRISSLLDCSFIFFTVWLMAGPFTDILYVSYLNPASAKIKT